MFNFWMFNHIQLYNKDHFDCIYNRLIKNSRNFIHSRSKCTVHLKSITPMLMNSPVNNRHVSKSLMIDIN